MGFQNWYIVFLVFFHFCVFWYFCVLHFCRGLFYNLYFSSSAPPGKGIPWLILCFLYILNPTAGLTWKFWIICFPSDIYQILDEYIEYCNVCWYSRIPSQTKPWSLDQLPGYQSVTCYMLVEQKTWFLPRFTNRLNSSSICAWLLGKMCANKQGPNMLRFKIFRFPCLGTSGP